MRFALLPSSHSSPPPLLPRALVLFLWKFLQAFWCLGIFAIGGFNGRHGDKSAQAIVGDDALVEFEDFSFSRKNLIGKGAAGRVYFDTFVGMHVAVKEHVITSQSSPKTEQEFIREVQLLKQLRQDRDECARLIAVCVAVQGVISLLLASPFNTAVSFSSSSSSSASSLSSGNARTAPASGVGGGGGEREGGCAGRVVLLTESLSCARRCFQQQCIVRQFFYRGLLAVSAR